MTIYQLLTAMETGGDLQRTILEEVERFDNWGADSTEARKSVKKIREYFGQAELWKKSEASTGQINKQIEYLLLEAARADQQKSLSWVERWAESFNLPLGRRYEILSGDHAGGIAICVSCPWKADHTEDTGDAQSVIIVDLGGKLNYLCRHGHCHGRGWKDFRDEIQARYYAEHPELISRDPPELQGLDRILKTIEGGYPVCFADRQEDAELLRATGRTVVMIEVWDKSFAPHFKGARVNIFPINSPESIDAAEQIQRDVKAFAYMTRCITVPRVQGLAEWMAVGNGPDDLKELIEQTEGIAAPWLDVDDKGKVTVNADKLSRTVAETVDHLIVREGGDDRDIIFLYKAGCYRRSNKGAVKGEVRKFLPPGKASETMLNNVYQMMFSQGGHIHAWEDLDRDEDIVNVENGLLYPFDEGLRPHEKTILSTRQLRVNYDPEATSAPVFGRFIADMTRDEDGVVDRSKAMILQELAGLVLSNVPGYRTKLAVVLYSPNGDTGKSVFFGLLGSFLGPGAVANIPLQAMNMNERFILGTILGTRLIAVGDQSGSEVKDSAIFKQLTGGDVVKIEAKGQQPLYYRFDGVVTIACNVLPSISDDKGSHLFGRMLILPLVNSIPRDKQDPELLDKLMTERPAILNWSMEGLRRLKANGYRFTRCQAAEEAMAEYRETLDTVFAFINEKCEVTRVRTDTIERKVFEDLYEGWAGWRTRLPVKRRNIKDRMAAIGIPLQKTSGTLVYRGITWKGGLMKAVFGDEEEKTPWDDDKRK